MPITETLHQKYSIMLDEIRKRPFIRPLFLWITGILLYTYCPSSLYAWVGFILLFAVLPVLYFSGRPRGASRGQAIRWWPTCWRAAGRGRGGRRLIRSARHERKLIRRNDNESELGESELGESDRVQSGRDESGLAEKNCIEEERSKSTQAENGRIEKGNGLPYAHRWIWGAVFAPLLLSLAMLATTVRTEWARKGRAETSLRAVSYAARSSFGFPFAAPAARTQEKLAERFDCLRLTEEEKSVLATLTLGYRGAMNREVRQRFSLAGVSHILAVSGFHVAVVAGFVSFLLAWLPPRGLGRGIRWLLMLAAVWGYVGLTGAAASAVRAGVMLTLFLTGRLLRRPTDRYNTWAAAAFCMLAYQPLYLFDIGFQLSYLAVFSILYFQPRLQRLLPVRNPVLAYPWQGLTLTVAAQVGTTFLCLYYFGRFPLFFLFTNLPVTLLATLLIPAGLVWAVWPPAVPGYGGLQTALEHLTRGMVGVVDGFGGIPGAAYPLSFDGFSLFCAYGALFFAALYGKQRRIWQLFTALGLVLIMLIERLIERFLLSGI